MYGQGISREGSLLDLSVDLGIVKKSGAWFTYEGEQLGQGRENAKGFLAENPEVMVEISEKVHDRRRPPARADAEPAWPTSVHRGRRASRSTSTDRKRPERCR